MADKESANAAAEPAGFSDQDKSRARQWFKKATETREKRDYDYAIECYITGLAFWPEAVEEGHKPLHSLAVQRVQAGGKKPGMMEGLKKPMVGKDAKQCMLNAEHLWAKDPESASYIDGFLKNATKAGFLQTVKWLAPLVLSSIKKEKKANVQRFKTLKHAIIETAERADNNGDAPSAAWLYELALNAIEYLIMKSPTEMSLRDEQRDLSGRLTIAKGKYNEAETFRDSIQDSDKQKLLHDAERVKQGDHTLNALVLAARKEFEAAPDAPAKINAYVATLLKSERKADEDDARQVLLDAYERSRNYAFKASADDIRLKQLRREVRAAQEKARASGSPDDKQQFRLAALSELETELEIVRERVEQYPTDLRLKFRLASSLFRVKRFDEVIPLLQAAQMDPRNRTRCQLLMGRAFYEKQEFGTAADVLHDALESYELTDDTGKELLYWMARAYEAAGKIEEAKAAFSKLLRLDYTYADGDARTRFDAMK